MNHRQFLITPLMLISLLSLSACSGGGGSAVAPPQGKATISGSVYAAPVDGAAVVVLSSGGTRTIAGPVTTAADGTYTITVPADALAQDLLFSSSAGTFDDEATGATTPAGNLAAYIASGSLHDGSTVSLDPSSTIIADLTVNHGKTIVEAQTAFSAAFGYTIDTSVQPRNEPLSAASTTAQRLAALRAMAFSQLTKDLGQGADRQFDLLHAMADDVADDGTLNGTTLVSIGSTTLPGDVENRFECALVTMLSDTVHNLTGLDPSLIGALPFGKVALTPSYRVEYLPGMMPAQIGKTQFKIKVTDRNTGSGIAGLQLSLMPMMHMATMSHAAPVDTVTDMGDGTYSCTVYYLMASGPGMGYWELKVMIGMESATFYPGVGMAMGPATVRANLKGQADMIGGMMSSEKRTYYLFPDSLIRGTTSTFTIFLAAKESMMSFPALSTLTTTTLHTSMGMPWTVNSVNILASTDGSMWTPTTAIETAMGHWSISGLTGLVSGQTGTIYIKLNVNGEDKTTDGNAASGANAFASFTVTP